MDSKVHHVIVPIEAPEEEDYYSVDRSSQRATLIGCIAADGTHLKPCVVIPIKTIERRLILEGYNDANCLIVSQEKGFVNAELFAFWGDHILFPEIIERRKKYGYDGTVVLTMDG